MALAGGYSEISQLFQPVYRHAGLHCAIRVWMVSQSVPFMIRMPVGLYNAIANEAERRGESMSTVVREAVREVLDARTR